jgi:FMN phosphatase YigB (HAD superfamily)
MKFELGSEPAVFFDVSGTLLDAAPSRLMGVDLFPDARLLIPKLRARSLAGHKIVTGVVTNWGHRVHSLFEALAISDCFDLVLTAQDTGLLKPDERVFAEAAKRADRNPSNCVLWEHSVRGGADCGCSATKPNLNPWPKGPCVFN